MGMLGASGDKVFRGVSSASESKGGAVGLVFVSQEVAPVGMGSPLMISGVFDGGGGEGFPLSSAGSKVKY